MIANDNISNDHELVLITGANGFIGTKVLESLLTLGMKHIRCFVRPTSNIRKMEKIISDWDGKAHIEIVKGNLLSRDDCGAAIDSVSVVYHLAAGRGEKSYPNAYLNSVVTTRNLLDAVLENTRFKRFVHVSSFTVYSNRKLKHGDLLDETCAVEERPELRGDAYCYAKVKQELLILEYHKKHNISYVIMRPGFVYGPGNRGITGRVGIDTFGFFLHLGGSNIIPLTYVDNCAEAIVLAGIKSGIDHEVLNVVDDYLPSSREFLRMYKKNVRHFKSIYIPKFMSYLLCYLWEKYSERSKGQLPPVFNRLRWSNDWKGNTYSNKKLKKLLGWSPKVQLEEGARQYFEFCRKDRDRNA
jgi:nucleoside-diphosphate-sugar epimerase